MSRMPGGCVVLLISALLLLGAILEGVGIIVP